MDWEAFFKENEKPKELETVATQLHDFCQYFDHKSQQSTVPIALVTSCSGTEIINKSNHVLFKWYSCTSRGY